ncbi:hypothetical protein H5410_001015 [Solanum commersonii]|uniref:Uncharacterized protein n=1 Tax=Solanum commersonii TaxID=4109 RepID=A0A9J6AYE1_SOLCO|nr:hypothetical protein H5410_001015 [Solanum commersonii]
MNIDEIDAIDEIDIDKDLNFFNESTNVSSFINGNFKMKMAAGSFYIPNSKKHLMGRCTSVSDGIGGWVYKDIDSGKYFRRLVRNVELSIHEQKDQNNKIQSMEVLNKAYFKHECQDGLLDSIHDTELEKLVHDGLVDLCELGTFSKMLAQRLQNMHCRNKKVQVFIHLFP